MIISKMIKRRPMHQAAEKANKKRKPEPDNVAAAASDNKKYRTDQGKAPSNAASEGITDTCELCNRSNHTTENGDDSSSLHRIPVDTSHSISLTMDMAQLRYLNLAGK